MDEALSAWARVKSELVRFADSVSLLARRSACGAPVWRRFVLSEGLEGWWRLRSVDVGSDVDGADGVSGGNTS